MPHNRTGPPARRYAYCCLDGVTRRLTVREVAALEGVTRQAVHRRIEGNVIRCAGAGVTVYAPDGTVFAPSVTAAARRIGRDESAIRRYWIEQYADGVRLTRNPTDARSGGGGGNS